MNADLDLFDAIMRKRSEHFLHCAKVITPLLHVTQYPELAIYDLLMDAYKEGGRDMHAAVLAIFDDATKSAT